MAITDLTGTKWAININPVLPQFEINQKLDFKCKYNNLVFDALIITNNTIYYSADGTGSGFFSATRGWFDDDCRYITIEGGQGRTDATLIAWLEANATQIIDPQTEDEYINEVGLAVIRDWVNSKLAKEKVFVATYNVTTAQEVIEFIDSQNEPFAPIVIKRGNDLYTSILSVKQADNKVMLRCVGSSSGGYYMFNYTVTDSTWASSSAGLQNILVSGENIKTVNNQSLLGSGDIDISGSGKFLAVYSQTTAKEIVDAFKAGKDIVVFDGSERELSEGESYNMMPISIDVYDTPGEEAIIITCILDTPSTGGSNIDTCFIYNVTGSMWNKTTKSVGGGSSMSWKPTVDAAGNLTWTLTDDTTSPTSQNIMGPAGAGAEDIVDGQWTIKKYADGTYEAWYAYWNQEYTIDVSEGAIFKSNDILMPFPSALNPQNKQNSVHFGSATIRNPNFDCWGAYAGQTHAACIFKVYSAQAREINSNYITYIYVKGKIG